jgi:hypothetical protein
MVVNEAKNGLKHLVHFLWNIPQSNTDRNNISKTNTIVKCICNNRN